MSSKEAKRERKQNPLISLLSVYSRFALVCWHSQPADITIELTDTSGSDSDVEADRKTARRGKLKFASSPEKRAICADHVCVVLSGEQPCRTSSPRRNSLAVCSSMYASPVSTMIDPNIGTGRHRDGGRWRLEA